MPRHAGPGGPGNGPNSGPRPTFFSQEDATQSSETNEDGSVTITQGALNRNGDDISRTVTVEDDTDAGVDITYSRTGRDGEVHERTVSIDADEDGGVDIDISITNREGEDVTRHIEIDQGEDGFEFNVTVTDADGNVETIDDPMLEQLLSNIEELTVEAVSETLLEHHGVDVSLVDLSTIDDFG